MLFGSRLNKLATSIRRALSEYAVLGINPPFVADFIEKKYLTGGASSTFSSAINHARAGNATMTDGYGPELVTNGGFDSDLSGWEASGSAVQSNQKAIIADSGGTDGYISQEISTVSGTTYIVEFNLSAVTNRIFLKIGTSENGNQILQESDTPTGHYSYTFTATASSTWITFLAYDANQSGAIDSVSVREMPVIKWAPHNVVTYSEEFDNANWTKTGTSVSENTAVAPNGTQTADKLIEGTSSGNKYTSGAGSAFAVTAGMKVTVSCFIKAGERTWCALGISKTSGQPFAGGAFTARSAYFNLSTGAAGTVGSSLSSSSITDVGDGWYLCSITGTAVASGGIAPFITIALGDGNASYTGDGSSGIYLWGAHLYRSDLGGMVDNPDRGDSYVPTAVRLTGSNLVQNGDFATDSDWTKGAGWSISGGIASVDSVANSNPALTQNIGATNDFYAVTLDVISTNGTGVLEVYHINLGASISFDISSTGTKTVYLNGGTHASNGQISLRARGGFIGSIDNVSVLRSAVKPNAARYLPRVGHHVYNGFAWVNEGLLAESESRTNLAVQSDMTDFLNAGVAKTTNAATSPDGTENALKIQATQNAAAIKTSGVLTNAESYAISFYAKAGNHGIIRIMNSSSVSSGQWFDLTNGTLLSSNGANNTATIQDVGNGWYRCTRYFDSVTVPATGSNEIYIAISDSDGATSGTIGDNVYLYGLQIENNATSSSFIPTSGSSVTRPAETFTIPSANLPWPTPQYIGSELVTNGDFSTDSDWTKNAGWSIASGVATYTNTGSNSEIVQTISGLTVGNVYQISVNIISNGSSIRLRAASPSAVISPSNITGTGEATLVFTAAGTNESIRVRANAGGDVTIDNISVREINPLSVSIGMEGRMTYADTNDDNGEVYFWRADNSNFIRAMWSTYSTRTGTLYFEQEEGGTSDAVVGPDTEYSPDILVPFNVASRHGSTFVNGAVDGVALTANTTPTALPDLSSTDLNLAYDYMGTISEFRVWDKDLGDAGIVEATNPSLEPSLSLTFEGTGTNSFVVNDWSQ